MKRDYRDKQITIIGAGSTGRSLAKFFLAQGARIVLSDNRSAELLDNLDELKKAGMTVARRTVTKYRKRMGIPSSRQRRDWSLVKK